MIKIKDITNAVVLVKVDYNIPSSSDLSRIIASKPTIDLLLKNNNKIVLISHFGRPEGKQILDFSLLNILSSIQQVLGQKIKFINQYDGFQIAKNHLLNSKEKIILLENTRFDPSEESQNNKERLDLAHQYAEFGDYCIDEAFSLSHRSEATNTEIKQFLPWCYGLNYEQEITNLDKIKNNSSHPFVVVMGGAKLETKLPLVEKLLPSVDKLLIAGQLAFTFLRAIQTKIDITERLVEVNFLEKARELISKYGDKLVLPVDFVSSEDMRCGDVGMQTIELFKSELSGAKTTFWNGPLGKYEDKQFQNGTNQIADYISKLNAFKVVGGGDIVAALSAEQLNNFDWVSTGGGATLEYLAK